jgi:hypothetical protein
MNYKAAGLTFLVFAAFVAYILIGYFFVPWMLIIPGVLILGSFIIGVPVVVFYWEFDQWLSRRKK